jgi:hypothetical protein
MHTTAHGMGQYHRPGRKRDGGWIRHALVETMISERLPRVVLVVMRLQGKGSPANDGTPNNHCLYCVGGLFSSLRIHCTERENGDQSRKSEKVFHPAPFLSYPYR